MNKKTSPSSCALVIGGGTGGHIFPGLALAESLRDHGWRVHWIGGIGKNKNPSMESTLVPTHNFPFEAIDFRGVRGKGWKALIELPWRLTKALWQSWLMIRRVRPDVVIGVGGYITLPPGMMAAFMGKPLVLHEQNSIPGMANRILAKTAQKVFTAFPGVLEPSHWVGNPLRKEFLNQSSPAHRFNGRVGPLKILVVGGSLGASILNIVIPKALELMSSSNRPEVIHQSGYEHFDVLKENYSKAKVNATLVPFIENIAEAFAITDLVICRAGAGTVTELAAIGAAAIFVPYQAAVDDHQTHNAEFMVRLGGAWCIAEKDFSPETLVKVLKELNRTVLLDCAKNAKTGAQLKATELIVQACEELT